ncbi:hypothetical protein [Gemmata sp.]|uniref:hypothetical protein n=1 Tax=Gemmata sp. TaxID=1914242 RepID=UPI003F7277E9
MPNLAVRIAAAACACLAQTGCVTGELAAQRSLSPDPSSPNSAKVKTPGNPKIPMAHLETSRRVEQLGKQILTQNPFTGVEPAFATAGVPETVLFHRGTEMIVVSEGLVKKCKTDAELAAVLCTELGQMVAEKQGLKRAAKDPIPESALPGGASPASGAPSDPGLQAELAFRERGRPRAPRVSETETAAKLSRELLRGAGFDPAEFDRVEPLVRQSDRGTALRKQMSDSAPPPKWDH